MMHLMMVHLAVWAALLVQTFMLTRQVLLSCCTHSPESDRVIKIILKNTKTKQNKPPQQSPKACLLVSTVGEHTHNMNCWSLADEDTSVCGSNKTSRAHYKFQKHNPSTAIRNPVDTESRSSQLWPTPDIFAPAFLYISLVYLQRVASRHSSPPHICVPWFGILSDTEM